MNAQMKEFLIAVSQDDELKNELVEKLGNEGHEATAAIKKVAAIVADFAKDKGYDCNRNTVIANTLKLDDEDLEEIAGGKLFVDAAGLVYGDCWCVAGGGGEADQYQKTCACVVGGGGCLTDEGEKLLRDHECHGNALKCPLVGCNWIQSDHYHDN